MNKPLLVRSIVCLLILALAGSVVAQTEPSTQPQRPPHVVTTPPGFMRVEIDGRTFVLRDSDSAWVRQTVASLQPTTMPTTMPSDLLERAQAARSNVEARLTADFAITDPALVKKLYDDRLLPTLRQLEGLDPKIVYLVTDGKTLRDIVKDGWQDPHLHYNRAADKVAINYAVAMDGQDESLLPFTFEPDTSEADKKQRLGKLISDTETLILFRVSSRAQELTLASFLAFLGEELFEPLKASPDQEWFGVGVSAVMAAKYAAPIIGLSAEDVIRSLSTDDPRNPVRSETIDLLNPQDLKQMNPQYVPAYVAAFRAKAIRAAKTLIDQAGDGVAGKVLSAWKQTPPGDGAALVALVQKTTGVDVTAYLRAK